MPVKGTLGLHPYQIHGTDLYLGQFTLTALLGSPQFQGFSIGHRSPSLDNLWMNGLLMQSFWWRDSRTHQHIPATGILLSLPAQCGESPRENNLRLVSTVTVSGSGDATLNVISHGSVIHSVTYTTGQYLLEYDLPPMQFGDDIILQVTYNGDDINGSASLWCSVLCSRAEGYEPVPRRGDWIAV